jgi:hypothetical protein
MVRVWHKQLCFSCTIRCYNPFPFNKDTKELDELDEPYEQDEEDEL